VFVKLRLGLGAGLMSSVGTYANSLKETVTSTVQTTVESNVSKGAGKSGYYNSTQIILFSWQPFQK